MDSIALTSLSASEQNISCEILVDSHIKFADKIYEEARLLEKYEDAGKNLLLRHLSNDCKAILKKAGPHCSYEEDDPTYKVAFNY